MASDVHIIPTKHTTYYWCCRSLILFFKLFHFPSEVHPPSRKAQTMSRRNGSGPKLDLKLNISRPGADRRLESPSRSTTASSSSPASSCLSSELNQEENGLRYSNSPEATSMVLVGCPRCLMYVMLCEDDPKCPKCKSTVLLDFLHDTNKPAGRRN
ncbi:uncharacterized protein LOC114743627 isoform X2 [Neltuma alba]|uniref:uncharacterized protein LOC114740862 isoform X2 n=1 Tax=Neltuma alba TaxID=207710 RepID=UPI0010A372CC|nr:uncharacterized protein LOC114740862 isoform X2 [Prosopis alba]XP_028787681.1 uncharacterized protein LOC114743627 isoform X2 [Prosopis alba]